MASYKTRQREEILNFFRENPERCVSVKEILKSENVTVGQATLYRTLSMLCEENVIKRFSSASGGDSFRLQCPDADNDLHIHIVCKRCGDMIHSDCEFVGEIRNHLSKDHGFTLDTSSTVIYGICKNCGRRPSDKTLR